MEIVSNVEPFARVDRLCVVNDRDSRLRRQVINSPSFRSRVRDAMDGKGLKTFRALADASRGALKLSTVHAVLSGRTTFVQIDTVRGLAETLDVTVEELTKDPSNFRRTWVLPEQFDMVPEDVRIELEAALEGMLRAVGLITDEDP